MTDTSLEGARVFVTGASRGIGRAASLAFAEAGADVALCARSKAELEAVAEEVRERGVAAVVCVADVTDTDAVRGAVRRAERAIGELDVLVANAGVNQPRVPLWEIEPATWWHVQRVNVLGVLNVVHAAVPGMIARGRGRIVHVASYSGIRPQENASAYAASKAAVMRLNDCLDLELEGTGVRSFAMSPGMVRTAMTEDVIRERNIDDEALAPIEDGARLIVRLASGEADALHGRMFHVTDDLDAMIAAADEIAERNWYQLRLVRGLIDGDPA